MGQWRLETVSVGLSDLHGVRDSVGAEVELGAVGGVRVGLVRLDTDSGAA